MSSVEGFRFESESTRVVYSRGCEDRIPAIPVRLVFAQAEFGEFVVLFEKKEDHSHVLSGLVKEAELSFQARWESTSDGLLRFAIEFFGALAEEWGAFQRLVLLDRPLGSCELESDLGWRELGKTSEDSLIDRPREEGGGLLPPFGYPIFGKDFFVGAEHPMACIEVAGSHVRVFHHPLWSGGRLQSMSLVIGLCRADESPAEAFSRYFKTIRRQPPERAIVEINTFWTDGFENETKYSGQTDIASYRAMAEKWSRDVLAGEKGLVSHFLLDAGWQNDASLYRPQLANGGPGDEVLAELGRAIQAEGFSFGLWFSVNGPIGVDPSWAASQGYRTHDQGTGAGYSANNGKIRYICLTDERWEEDLSKRFEELIGRVPVQFFKGDWDNDGIEDPARYPGDIGSQAQLREANANAMIRIYGCMHGSRSDVALRGAWWLSPWWFSHVDNTHLPNSGDMESCDLPSLTQRDSGLTCRDAMCYHVMVRHRSPIPWDVLCPHEFASSRRNPVQDTMDSWMNNLAIWTSRGTHYLQLYLAPYGLAGWKAWSLRESLRWFRSDEDLHWKCGTSMLGADPVSGGVYGFYHESGDRTLLTIRNPKAHPQPLCSLSEWGLSDSGWQQIYPFLRPFISTGYMMSSHEVIMLTGGREIGDEIALVNTSEGWRQPVAVHPPVKHQLGESGAILKYLSPRKLAIHATLPYGLASAEVVLSIRSVGDRGWRAAVGRYEEDVASFGVPITHVRPHWQSGYAQGRLRTEPQDPSVSVLRIPIGTGGEAHCFLYADQDLPEILGAWIEVRDLLVPAGVKVDGVYPPAMDAPLRCLLTVDISK